MFNPRFKSLEKEGLAISLANYFNLIGEGPLAKKIYTDFRKHPFVGKNGEICTLLCTKLVSDLTEGVYRGTFQYYVVDNIENSLRSTMQDRYNQGLKIVDEETRIGNLVGGNKTFEFSERAILLQNTTEVKNHWIVDCGNDYVIYGDGSLKKIENHVEFYLSIDAVLLINNNYN